MKIENVPRIRLANLPTPLEPLPRLTEYLKGPRIFIKRDDYTGMGLGGNKVRKLEYLMCDVLQKRAQVVITGAGQQSNHCRITAAVARRLGLSAILVLSGTPPTEAQGNLLLDEVMGAEIVYTGEKDLTSVDRVMKEVYLEAEAKGRKPYLIPRGGATSLGSLGYVSFVEELSAQMKQMDLPSANLVCAVGSCGTMAGICLGTRLYQADLKLWGISVNRSKSECLERIPILIREAEEMFDPIPNKIPPSLEISDKFVGLGYAIADTSTVSAVRLLAELEGIFLDPVYTGKAFNGLLSLVKENKFSKSDNLIFLHTGGSPAIFAFSENLRQKA